MPDYMMTLDEVSAQLRVKPKTIYSWVAKRSIPFTKLGSQLRFPSGLIEQWSRKRTYIPKSMAA